jgi:serine/threonine-protein kinase RsbW
LEISNASSSKVLHSEFPGQYESLAPIAAFVRVVAVEAGLDDFSVYSVETAVDEGCSNIIEHAYKRVENGIIEITCIIEPGQLIVELNDNGKPFNPSRVPRPGLGVPLGKRKDNGLGLFLIYRLMDEVTFSFDKNTGNTLTLKKKLV